MEFYLFSMKKSLKVSVVLLRLLLGWLFLYSGLTKVLDPAWSAAGFLGGAENFSAIYGWFASAANIGWVDFLNEWGQLFIGLGLVFGTLTRMACFAGVLLMVLYYLPGLSFPYVDHGFLVDSHIIYAAAFLLLANLRAGQYLGFDQYLQKKFKNFWI